MVMTRYLIRSLFFALSFVALTITSVLWLTQSLHVLELIANSDAPFSVFIKLTALSLPKSLEIVLPLSLVIAILFVYNKLIMDNELIVMRACGIGPARLAGPALALAALTTAVLLSLTTYVSPTCWKQMHALRQDISTKYTAFLLRAGVFNTVGNGLTIYVRTRDDQGNLTGLMIYDTREQAKPPVTVTAKRGRFFVEPPRDGFADGVPGIVLYDGLRQQPDAGNGALTRLYFSEYTIEITGLVESPEARWLNSDERTLPELFRPDKADQRARQNRGILLAEANNRLITPFNALGFTLVALIPMLLGGFNRRGNSIKIMAVALAILLCEAANVSLVSQTKKDLAVLPALYAATFLPVLLGLALLHPAGEKRLALALRALKSWRRPATPA
jgi:lipopolysaccharide export system permease protein